MLERTRRPEKNLSYFSRGLLLPSIADIIILISKFRASGSGYVDFKSIEITINVQVNLFLVKNTTGFNIFSKF
ncbi:MAG: hypothetical protein QW607_11830 [Desulfurococcaceae archaeon]